VQSTPRPQRDRDEKQNFGSQVRLQECFLSPKLPTQNSIPAGFAAAGTLEVLYAEMTRSSAGMKFSERMVDSTLFQSQQIHLRKVNLSISFRVAGTAQYLSTSTGILSILPK
jgi:hypothetical protein